MLIYWIFTFKDGGQKISPLSSYVEYIAEAGDMSDADSGKEIVNSDRNVNPQFSRVQNDVKL